MDSIFSRKVFDDLVKTYGQMFDIKIDKIGKIEMTPMGTDSDEPEEEIRIMTTPQNIAPMQSEVAPALKKLMK
jgi:hypothetical protein